MAEQGTPYRCRCRPQCNAAQAERVMAQVADAYGISKVLNETVKLTARTAADVDRAIRDILREREESAGV